MTVWLFNRKPKVRKKGKLRSTFKSDSQIEKEWHEPEYEPEPEPDKPKPKDDDDGFDS